MAVVSKENAEHYLWGEVCDGWHLVKSKGLSVIQECVPPGKGEVRHLHQTAEQFFFVLSGIASLEVDGKVLKVAQEQGVHVPANTPHRLFNEQEQALHFMVISTPPAQGDRQLL